MAGYILSCHTAVMDDRGLQGWTTDPFRLHEERYFSAGRPTKLVRDGGVDSYDEPPSGTYNPVAAAPPPADPPRHDAPPQYAGPPGYDGPPRYAGPAGLRAPDPGFAPVSPRRRAGLFVAAALVVVVAALAGVKLVSGSGSTTNSNRTLTTSPVAFVTHSAARTLAQHTVDLTVSGAIAELGKSITVDGTGQLDFDTNAMALDMHMASSSGSVDYKVIQVNGNLYFAISVNGAGITQFTGGRTWVQTPVQQSESAGLAGSDPLSSLSVLEQQGSTVRQLGSKTIDGVTCTGYAVTPSLQAMLTETRQEDAKQGISAATTEQDLQQVRDSPLPTITIWSDAQGLVHEISINMQISVNMTGGSTSGDLVLDFTHFGAPVSITAPPPADTISSSSFQQDLGNQAS